MVVEELTVYVDALEVLNVLTVDDTDDGVSE